MENKEFLLTIGVYAIIIITLAVINIFTKDRANKITLKEKIFPYTMLLISLGVLIYIILTIFKNIK